MGNRPTCPIKCVCICHDTGGGPTDHIPGLKGCPGKHGYIMIVNGQWVKE